MTMPKTTVDVVSIDDGLESLALRSALEFWGIQVTLHLIGQAKDLVSTWDQTATLTDRHRYSMCCNWVTNGFAKAAR